MIDLAELLRLLDSLEEVGAGIAPQIVRELAAELARLRQRCGAYETALACLRQPPADMKRITDLAAEKPLECVRLLVERRELLALAKAAEIAAHGAPDV